MQFSTMPSKTETGLEHICFWAFSNPLWVQANCRKCLEFCYNKYSVELELVPDYTHVFWSFSASSISKQASEENRHPTVFEVDCPSVSRTPVDKILLHQRSLKLCMHMLLRLSPSWLSSLIFSGIRSSDITYRWQRQTERVLVPKGKLSSGGLTWVSACRVDSFGFKRCNTSSVHFKVLSQRCSTNEDCCCWRILNRSLTAIRR